MTPQIVAMANGASRFPPSFEDSPFSYGFALFNLTLISAVSLGVIVGWALEARRRREVDRLVRNVATRDHHATLSPLVLHRIIVSGLLLTIIFGALPDVLVLLAWGEATDRTMEKLFMLDRFFDGMTGVPFFTGIGISIMAGQAVDHRLAVQPLTIRLRPTWGMVRDKLKIAGLVLLIALGVTAYKSVSLA